MKRYLQHIGTIIGLIIAWQLIVSLGQLPDYILPAPTQVFALLYEYRYLLLQHTLPTIEETLIGFTIGVLTGCIAGCAIAFSRHLARWFLPLLIISQAVPVFTIAPLLVIWLGYGMASKIAACVIMIFFPVTSALYDGLKQTDKGWLELARTMNASRARLFWNIQIPAALPSLASGLRIAAVIAPIGAIVGEWVGSSRGLGYLMLNANARLQVDMMFAALIVIIAMSLALYFCVDKLLRKLVWW